MAAGMHLAPVDTRVRERVVLGHRQRINVSAQTYRPGATTVAKNTNYAGSTQASMNGDTPFGQCPGYQIGGTLFLEAQLGVRMEVAPQRRQNLRVGNRFD
jgi:hypothetical protein